MLTTFQHLICKTTGPTLTKPESVTLHTHIYEMGLFLSASEGDIRSDWLIVLRRGTVTAFKSRREHGCLSLETVVCYQVGVSASY